ncbi:MAG: YkgJ family cysteine cluster protein [Planctomycetota bacterium]
MKQTLSMEESPWYTDGLRFQCAECGGCCTGGPGFVWVNKAEIENLAAALSLSVAEFEDQYVRQIGIRRSLKERSNFDCVLFDSHTGKCRVYAARPRQCRTWPFWNSNLASPEAWKQTAQSCPGIGKGTLYQLADIESRRQTILL